METDIGKLGWLAGVLDCDSSIYVARAKRTHRRRPYNYRIEVSVEGVDPRKPWECYKRTELGEVRHEKTHKEGSTKSNTVRWRVRGRNAITILEHTLPLMVAKREQAELAIKFGKTVKDHWSELTDEDYAFQQWAWVEMKELRSRHSLQRKIWTPPTD